MASMIVASGESTGTYYPLGHRTNVLGRSESLLIQILDDQVSRKHLQVRYAQDTRKYSAVDMNSRNGVFINGRKIEEETPLADLPSRTRVLELFGDMETTILDWLRGHGDAGLTGSEPTWPWTGDRALGQALYLLRHLQHHVAQMSGECKRRGLGAVVWG